MAQPRGLALALGNKAERIWQGAAEALCLRLAATKSNGSAAQGSHAQKISKQKVSGIQTFWPPMFVIKDQV